ncbi:MAG TPA: VOC family protein [Gemmataceae bacterium]
MSKPETSRAERIIEEFERGNLTRRQLAAALLGLGAAAAGGARAQAPGGGSTFAATGLDHVALDVTDLVRSRDFYVKHLGLKVIREDERAAFLGHGDGFILTLFRAGKPGLNHYCYAIRDYDPGRAVEKLKAAGLKPRREGDRVYFDDPDGIEVQVTGA